MRNKKRILSILLSMCMTAGFMPATALAAGTELQLASGTEIPSMEAQGQDGNPVDAPAAAGSEEGEQTADIPETPSAAEDPEMFNEQTKTGEELSGACGENMTWTLTGEENNLTLTISGTGSMYTFWTTNTVPWFDQRNSIIQVELGEGITDLGNYVFYECSRLTSIVLPESLTGIGSSAFRGCTGLTDLTFQGNVPKVAEGAFETLAAFVTYPEGNTSWDGIKGNATWGGAEKLTWPRFLARTDKQAPVLDWTGQPLNLSVDKGEYYTWEGDGTASFTYYTKEGDTYGEAVPQEPGTYYAKFTVEASDGYEETTAEDYMEFNIWKNTFGGHLVCQLDEEGTLTITGEGEMPDFNEHDRPWHNVRDQIKKVVVQQGVTSIGVNAFSGCTNLTDITIPESITSIGGSSFSDCSSLVSIEIPQNVKRIDHNVFWKCSSLENINIPDGTTDIGSQAFYYCSSLKSIVIPGSVTGIGMMAFWGAGLESITFLGSAPEVGFFTFGGITAAATYPDGDTSWNGIWDDATWGDAQSLTWQTTHTLVYTDAKEPACTEDGNIEFWSCSVCHRIFSDEEGTAEITEDGTIIPADGHTYVKPPSWSWTNVGNGYTANLRLDCNKCGTAELIPADVTKETEAGIITYTATAEYDGTAYNTKKTVQESYSLAVAGGSIDMGGKYIFSHGDAVKLVADPSDGTHYFSGWYIGDTRVSDKETFILYMTSNMTVVARFEGESVKKEQPVISLLLSEREKVDQTAYEKAIMTAQWSLPDHCKFISAGFVRSYDDSKELVLENVDGTDVRKNSTVLTTRSGTYRYSLTMSETTKLKTLYVSGYLTYQDENGAEKTIYTEKFSSAYSAG